MTDIPDSFGSLEQRIIHSFLATMPPLVPAGEATAPLDSQRELWALINAALQTLYTKPETLTSSRTPDRCFETFAPSNSDPALYKAMGSALGKLERLGARIVELVNAGRMVDDRLVVPAGRISLTRPLIHTLSSLGFTTDTTDSDTVLTCPGHQHSLPALQFLAKKVSTIGDKHMAARVFWNCCLVDDYAQFGRSIYMDEGSPDSTLTIAIRRLLDHGYWDHATPDHGWRYDVIRNHGDRTLDVCTLEAAKHYWGLSVYQDLRWRQPLTLALRLPRYHIILENFGELPAAAQQVVASRTKRCDGCGFCTQMAKGERRRVAVTVNHGRKLSLCPMFPVWSFQTTDLTGETVEELITVLDAANDIYSGV